MIIIIITSMESNNIAKYDFYVLIYNIQSRHNINSLIRSAMSFGSNKFLVLGKDKKVLSKLRETEMKHLGEDIRFDYFDTIDELKLFLKENSIFVCGVEIGENCVPIQNHVFKGNTLFVLGNEGAGMNQKQKDLCDQFVYIQQYSNKTGSLNVVIAASIIFHHFGIWSGYKDIDLIHSSINNTKETIKYEAVKDNN